jgi:hypothetical protein
VTGDLPPELAELTTDEREVLAALAVLGAAAVSPEQLAALTAVADPRPVLEELERRGFVRREEDDRYAVPSSLRDRLRHAWNLVDTGDRVLRQLISIAEDGRLTMSDLDAVLGVSEWACETGRFVELLRLVRAVRTTVDVFHRVEAWATIARRARDAARAIGDRDAEAWAERELAMATRAVAPRRTETRARESAQPEMAAAGRLPRWLLLLAAVAAAAAAGLVVGLIVAKNGPAEATTVSTTSTVAGPGGVTTVTVTDTTTVTTTTTFTTTASPIP